MPFAAEGDALGLRQLWTDAPDAHEQLQAKVAAKIVKKTEVADLTQFIDHGWLIKRGAIPHDVIDAFVADIRSHHERPGYFVKTDHRNGRSQLTLSGSDEDRFESLFDLYVNMKSSRLVCLHKTIQRFLGLVFDDQVVAFQQLLFQRSNGHQVHSDTAFVALEDPLLLAASWIALEDVVEGSGELGFYDRSHKLPHYVFPDGSKRSSGNPDDLRTYTADLDAECQRRGLAYERFLAKKGDVFFWAADLVHRSQPKSLPDETSRLSCVTHYCPATTVPFWFRFHPDNRGFEPHGKDGRFASSYYALPNKGRPVTPNGNFAA